MKVIALIPARLASQRLPNKPLLDLAGKPMIVQVCNNLSKMGILDEIVVAADHPDIAQAVENAGFRTVLTDPDLPSGTDRVAAAARILRLSPESLIINVQGDEPFVSEEALLSIKKLLHLNPAAVATVCTPIHTREQVLDPNIVNVALGADFRALYFSRAGIPFERDAASDHWQLKHHYRHIGLYGYRADVLQNLCHLEMHPLEALEKLEQLRWLANGQQINCAIVEAMPRGVDTAEELDEASRLWLKREKIKS